VTLTFTLPGKPISPSGEKWLHVTLLLLRALARQTRRSKPTTPPCSVS